MKISTKGLEMVAMPLFELVEGMIPQEDAINYEANFMKNLIDAFMPVSDSPLIDRFQVILTNIAVLSANREPEKVKARLIQLKQKLDEYLV